MPRRHSCWRSDGIKLESILLLAAVVMGLKGLLSVLLTASSGFYIDVLGWLDCIAGLYMWFIARGHSPPFSFYVASLLLLKGAYSVLVFSRE